MKTCAGARPAFAGCCSLMVAAFVAGCTTAAYDYRWEERELGGGASLRGISALDRNVVWTTGTEGTIFKTESGGRTWEKVVIPNTAHLDFRDVEVLSRNIVVVMSAGVGDKSRIYRTTDGGETWHEALANTHEEGFYDGIAFWDAEEGMLGGDPVAGDMYFAKTVDGGRTWQRVDPGLLPALNSGETGGFAASGSHLAVHGNTVWISSVYAGSRVTFSRDRGHTWDVVDTPIVQEEKTQGIFSLAFFDESMGVAVGGDYAKQTQGADNVMLTADGGLNWRFAGDFPVFQSSVRYLSRDHLVSVGPEAGYYSTDGGNHWRRIDGKGYHALSVAEGGAVWASGQDGRVGRLVTSPR